MFIQFISNFLIDAVYYILSVSRKSERVGISVWDTLCFQISCKDVLKRKEKKKKNAVTCRHHSPLQKRIKYTVKQCQWDAKSFSGCLGKT